MEEEIKNNIDQPEQLEQLYRSDKKQFAQAFQRLTKDIGNKDLIGFWSARLALDHPKESMEKNKQNKIYLLLIACLFTGFLIKLPQLFSIPLDDYFFFQKNVGLIVLLGLSIYSFLTKMTLNNKQLLQATALFVVSAVYINLLPSNSSSSVNLAHVHLPLFLWCLYGLIFIDFDLHNKAKRMDYIKYNGDIAILTAIILISGGILTGVTLGLFAAIDLKIEDFYFDYIVVPGLVSSPIVATYVVKNFPSVTNKIAPIIAHIFSPIVLLTLVIYLISIALTGKDPYNDRDFLIVFNGMLIGVMGIIVFSVAETSIKRKQRFNELTLFSLSIVTLIIDIIALSAIVYRLGEFGFTPNRTVALGANLLIFGHLLLIMMHLYKVVFRGKEIKTVEMTIANYLPFYSIWTIFVTFALPFLFGLN